MADRAPGAEYEHPLPKVHPPDTAAILDAYLHEPKTVLPLHSRPHNYDSEGLDTAAPLVTEKGYISEGMS